MASGQIAETKTRYGLVIDKNLKAELEKLAQQDKRSFNNLVNMILEDYVNSHK